MNHSSGKTVRIGFCPENRLESPHGYWVVRVRLEKTLPREGIETPKSQLQLAAESSMLEKTLPREGTETVHPFQHI